MKRARMTMNHTASWIESRGRIFAIFIPDAADEPRNGYIWFGEDAPEGRCVAHVTAGKFLKFADTIRRRRGPR